MNATLNPDRAMKFALCVRSLVWSLCLGSVLAASSAHAAGGVTRGYSGTQIFSTLGTDKDEGEPNHCGEPGGASSWFFYQAPSNGVFFVDPEGSSFDTVLAVYTGPGTDFASLVPVTCNNDVSATQTWSRVSFLATAGTMYFIAVDGVGGASGTVKLNYFLSLYYPLAISSQPQSQVAALDSAVSFQVEATGTAPLSYQWWRNGALVEGATAETLVLSAVGWEEEGEYGVVVSDALGTLASAPALLTVCAAVPATNQVTWQKVSVSGQEVGRVTGHAAVGTVLEASTNLEDWQPVSTNQSSLGLFIFDDPAVFPMRYYRLRLAP